MKKILLFSNIILISLPIALLISCKTKKQSVETNSLQSNQLYTLDEEGFPIHSNTELVKGEGDLSIIGVEKHLKKYLTLPNDAASFTEVGVVFEKMGSDNIWTKWKLDKIDKDGKSKSKWNSGNPGTKEKPNKWKIYDQKSPEYKTFQANGEEGRKDEYMKRKGWKRFANKFGEMKFSIYINGYPTLKEPKKFKIDIIIVDNIFQNPQTKERYSKTFTLATLDNVNKSKINKLKGNTKQPKDKEKLEKIIEKFLNFQGESILKKLYGMLEISFSKEVLKNTLHFLDNKINKKLLEVNDKFIQDVSDLFVQSPYIDVNKLIEVFSSNTYDKIFLMYSLKSEDTAINQITYPMLVLSDYIKTELDK